MSNYLLSGREGWLSGSAVPQHSVAGNPMRFGRDPIRFELDREWETAISRSTLLATTLLTGPLLAHYGYGVRLERA